MILDDRVFGYVASADKNEARLAAVAADVESDQRSVAVCIIVANQLTIDLWRDAFALAADTAQRAGLIGQAAAFRESFDRIEMANNARPPNLGIVH